MSRTKKQAGSGSKSKINVLFIAGFGPIVRDLESSRNLYENTLGISFEEAPGGYLHTGKLDGAKHFALWPLAQASESCFGTDSWPSDVPTPQAWVEFDVENIQEATVELKKQGYRLLVAARKEPWGQTVTRLLGPEGLLVGVTHTPWMRAKQ
jgi:catechol 2,3-dioxygenase-like lactoylglutathione lyase family enzyme